MKIQVGSAVCLLAVCLLYVCVLHTLQLQLQLELQLMNESCLIHLHGSTLNRLYKVHIVSATFAHLELKRYRITPSECNASNIADRNWHYTHYTLFGQLCSALVWSAQQTS